MGQVTTLLSSLAKGNSDAFGELYALLYPELHRLAHSRVRRSSDMTLLDTTSLVHEAYLRFENVGAVTFRDRSQFMAYAARVMRSIVVDAVRRRNADRHGGPAVHVELEEAEALPVDSPAGEVLRVHDALEELEAIDPRLVQVVEMRYFAGMTLAEIAAALNLTERTVGRDWEKARLFLHTCLR
jgi:RNA polymerase sigma factor (TIGR02999 family)